MEESWMKLPNGGARIMLEKRDGLFFLPVYRADAKAAPGLVSQSTVTVASLASGSVERDTSGNDVVELIRSRSTSKRSQIVFGSSLWTRFQSRLLRIVSHLEKATSESEQ